MIVDLRCPQCNRTIDASKQEVVTCGQQVVDQVYMKHQWCARCDVAIRLVETNEDPTRAYLFVTKESAQQVVDGIETENWQNRDSGASYDIEQV